MSMSQAGDAKSRELIQTVSQISNGLMNEVSKVIIGKQENLRRVTIGILSNGNMLIEDFPGLAKTLMANTFSSALGCKFKRVQFTPDLLPADVMGTYMYDQQAGEFKLRPGPLFTNLLLADERLTEHRRRHRPHFWRPWRRSRSPSRELHTSFPLPSSQWQHRIRSSKRGHTHCLRHRWTGSS